MLQTTSSQMCETSVKQTLAVSSLARWKDACADLRGLWQFAVSPATAATEVRGLLAFLPTGEQCTQL